MIKLSNNYKIPIICYGTGIINNKMYDSNKFKQFLQRFYLFIKKIIKNDNTFFNNIGIIKCTKNAIKYNCNFFDTSRAYGKAEYMISRCLKDKERNKYFICTKISNSDQLSGKSAKDVLNQSLKELNVEYIDVLLLHWPVEGTYLKYWKEMEELYKDGKVKSIGVSNCKIHHLQEIKKIASVMPMINEVELHPLLTEIELRKYCMNNNIKIMAYTSTARGDFRLKSSRRLQNLCKKYNKSLNQLILRWHIQNGIIPIFNTSSLKHFKDNMNIFDFEISDDDMEIIEGMNINSRTRYDSDNCEFDRL